MLTRFIAIPVVGQTLLSAKPGRQECLPHRELLLSLALFLVQACFAADSETWTGWRGPHRDGVSPVKLAVPESWPAKLREVWTSPAKAGFSTPVFDGRRVFIQFRENGNEHIMALEADSGKAVWRAALGTLKEPQVHDPVPTPQLGPGSALYVYSMEGGIYQFDAKAGMLKWNRDLTKEWKGEGTQPMYGVAASPLLWDGALWLPLGDQKVGKIVAINPETAATVWSAECPAPGYSSFVGAKLGGVECAVTLLYNSVFAVKKEGKSYAPAFSAEFPGGHDGNSATPVILGENELLLTGAEETVALRVLPGAMKTEEIWRLKEGANLSTPVFANGRIYAHFGGELVCLDPANGKTLSKLGMDAQHCGIVASGNMLLCRLHEGTLKFISIEQPEMKLLANYEPAAEEGETWSTAIPVAPRRIVMRLGERFVCLEY